MTRVAALFLVTSLLLPNISNGAEDFRISSLRVTDSRVQLTYPFDEGFYYLLYRGDQPSSISELVDLTIDSSGGLEDRDYLEHEEAYYRVQRVSVENSLDSDQDELDDVVELRYPTILDSLDSGDADLDFDNDGKTNKEELNDPINPTDPGDAVFETIRFETSDRFNIAASLGIPKTRSDSLPAVIFIHQGGSTRKEWEPVAKLAFREGWVTLAYDIRGHGASSGSWSNAWYDDPNNAPNDLKAAIEYLKRITTVDDDRIAVVGASVGGNLACVASAFYGVKSAVAISHKTSAVFNLAGEKSLEFRSIYHLSSKSDQGGQRARWATELFEQTAEPRRLEIADGSGHGVSIFRRDASIPDRIIQWLRETL
ncbi:alpha/beta fold hydrolase [Verrucomicrobia bacterium]|jgi:dienelactone hydrolase|nr:alpha/beta fold hydrolase [Verrucomicrobiota bacterium]MDB4798776.1 alpha/beta fold hydrolase [Verrucomicrobiota bacterium]